MRAKIIIPNLLVVLCIGVGVYFYTGAALRKQSKETLEKQLKVVAALFTRSEELRGHEQLQEVRKLSMSRSISSVFNRLNIDQVEGETASQFENRIREAWFKKAVIAVETASVSLEQKGRTPALVFITDRNGVVLARNTTPNACPTGKNVATVMSAVQRALDGEAGYTVWSTSDSPFGKNDSKDDDGHVCTLMNKGLLEISAAPIWGGDDQVAGVIAVGYEISNGMALEKSKTLGLDLAVVHSGDVYSTSLITDTAAQMLNDQLNTPLIASNMKKVFNGKNSSSHFTISVEERSYLAVAAPVPNAAEKEKIAYVFMGVLENTQGQDTLLRLLLLVFGVGLGAIVVVGYFLGNHFMKPIVEIEEGVLKIINGEYEYRFDVESDEVGGLSYRINQLVNVLTELDESQEPEETSIEES